MDISRGLNMLEAEGWGSGKIAEIDSTVEEENPKKRIDSRDNINQN